MTDRSITLGMLAEMVGGTVDGDAATVIRGAAVLREVRRGEITFIDQPERIKQLAATQAAAVVLPEKLDVRIESGSGTTRLAGRRFA